MITTPPGHTDPHSGNPAPAVIPALAWMAYFALGPGQHLRDEATDAFPPVPGGPCCVASHEWGPGHCTCWKPIYDTEQQPIDTTARDALRAGIQPNTRTRMCDDCAYRPGSPEKTGDARYVGDAGHLEHLARTATRFWCHVGMRAPAKWVHPTGAETPAHSGDYKPPIDKTTAVPFKADGTPADLCAGWDARRRALAHTTPDHP